MLHHYFILASLALTGFAYAQAGYGTCTTSIRLSSAKTCEDVSEEFFVSKEAFTIWNPSVGPDCSAGVQPDVDYCIEVDGYFAVYETATPTATRGPTMTGPPSLDSLSDLDSDFYSDLTVLSTPSLSSESGYYFGVVNVVGPSTTYAVSVGMSFGQGETESTQTPEPTQMPNSTTSTTMTSTLSTSSSSRPSSSSASNSASSPSSPAAAAASGGASTRRVPASLFLVVGVAVVLL
ncbi:hypothetical protein B9Z65_1820 [Elsinoe australis]|uniref:LysM domain-containing protein n=1 Tax=Elsinoe australis TaxID=40998 RepID=A0A2P7YKY9_9PEZI|nr:hypothetical protein B9Z65_1820 [Elsinoe australis]